MGGRIERGGAEWGIGSGKGGGRGGGSGEGMGCGSGNGRWGRRGGRSSQLPPGPCSRPHASTTPTISLGISQIESLYKSKVMGSHYGRASPPLRALPLLRGTTSCESHEDGTYKRVGGSRGMRGAASSDGLGGGGGRKGGARERGGGAAVACCCTACGNRFRPGGGMYASSTESTRKSGRLIYTSLGGSRVACSRRLSGRRTLPLLRNLGGAPC